MTGPRPEAHDALTSALIRLADGDRSAFDPVYDATWPRVQAVTRRLLGDGPDADDAAQIAITKVFERVSEFDPAVGRALPWILGIAGWEARTLRRRRGRCREHGAEVLPEPATAPVQEAGLLDAELLAALEDALDELRPGDRETLLVALGRRPRPEIAPATYRKRLQRALDRLRTLWRSEHG